MTRPVYSGEHGTEAARRWHVAHGSRCRVCWPTPSGLPPMPPMTASTRPWWLNAATPADNLEDVA